VSAERCVDAMVGRHRSSERQDPLASAFCAIFARTLKLGARVSSVPHEGRQMMPAGLYPKNYICQEFSSIAVSLRSR
jgi:hypothetical protein